MEKVDLTVVIISFNEEKNIRAAIESVGFAKEVFVVDSGSADRTAAISREYGTKVLTHKFETHSKQLNWALKNLPVKTEWILKLDSDETVSDSLKKEILEKLPNLEKNIKGVYLKRKVIFLGRWIKWGGFYPTWLLRIWRNGTANFEERLMDEHVNIRGQKTIRFSKEIIDKNNKGIDFWINKHSGFATREAIELIYLENKVKCRNQIPENLFGKQEERKRWIKNKVYVRLPLFLRALMYYIYRYFFLLGFLDGKEGLIFHFLQAFWYRLMVDVKIFMIKKMAKEKKISFLAAAEELFEIRF